MNNQMVAHAWAQQNRLNINHPINGKSSNGNFSFEGKSLFSYKTEIARFYGNRVIYTNKKYTVTTEGKHKRALHNAISHLESYGVNCEIKNLSESWNDVKLIIAETQLSAIRNIIRDILKSKKYISILFDNLLNKILKYNSFRESYLIESCESFKNIRFPEHLKHYFKVNYNFDVSAKIEKIAKAERKRQEKYEKTQEIKLAQWLKGENVTYSGSKLCLRIKNNQIETTKGAKISVNDAIAFYEKLKTPVMPIKINEHFTATEIRDNCIIAGCHTIPLTEIYKIAKELNI